MARKDAKAELQDRIAATMMDIITRVMSQQDSYYEHNPDKIPDESDIDKIITKYSRRSMLISGGAGLAPGPLGLIAVVPEVLAIIDSQIRLIYDIGVAYGKQKYLTKELILGVFASAAVTGTIGIISIQGTKVLVKNASASLIKRIIRLVAVKTTQGAFRSMVGKFVPMIGAAAIAAWSNYSTKKVGRRSVNIFSRDIEYLDNVAADITETEGNKDSTQAFVEQENQSEDELIQVEKEILMQEAVEVSLSEYKIQSLINLMLVDGDAHPEEQEYIREIIEGVDLEMEKKMRLLEALEESNKYTVDYSHIAQSPDDSLGLLVDLVTLSNHDGKFAVSEKMYVKQVGKALGFMDEDIDEMMAESVKI